jgi:2-phospho-L-lactate guanylyltransferase (CobY/MobA/RfbA family)
MQGLACAAKSIMSLHQLSKEQNREQLMQLMLMQLLPALLCAGSLTKKSYTEPDEEKALRRCKNCDISVPTYTWLRTCRCK